MKRIAQTRHEAANPRDTANHHELPAHFQYGIASPGYNAWRELAANELVTAATLAGETAHFPLLHHWRVLPGAPPTA